MNPPRRTSENGFFNKDFRPSTQPCPEQIPTVAQTQHSTQPQHRHMPEAIQMQPRHIRTNASQISWKHKWDAQKRCAPQPHIQPWQSFSHAFWYLTFYLTFITDILYHVLSDELIFWHIACVSIWHTIIQTLYLAFNLTSYTLSDIYSWLHLT